MRVPANSGVDAAAAPGAVLSAPRRHSEGEQERERESRLPSVPRRPAWGQMVRAQLSAFRARVRLQRVVLRVQPRTGLPRRRSRDAGMLFCFSQDVGDKGAGRNFGEPRTSPRWCGRRGLMYIEAPGNGCAGVR